MDNETNSTTCPACGNQFKKAPQRKTKCQSCGSFVYVRTRPSDRLRVLVTAQDAAQIDAEWETHGQKSRIHLPEKDADFELERIALEQKFGGPPRDADVFWSLLQKKRASYATQREWELYRNSCLDLANVLLWEDRFASCIPHLVDVCLLDCWLEDAKERELNLPPFPLDKQLLYGVVALLLDAMKRSNTTKDELINQLRARRSKLPMLHKWNIDIEALSRAILSYPLS